MFLKVVILLLCVTYAVSEYVNSADCQNTTVFSKNVQMEVSECNSEHEHCPLYQGTVHKVTFHFEPTKDFASNTDFRVHGVFPKFTVPYGRRGQACDGIVDEQEACKNSGFVTSQQYKHESTFAVSNTYPKIKLRVRFSMSDRKTKEYLLCREVPVEIKDPLPTPSPQENEAK
ncbi:uncharacterized protein LOC118181051 [Stegodyphus dumicola]|uniref:uncharacterized protein LOC118181051 n=1 Tax=Stegodyphus dumicola TaxID=202533 RepID=UPI0015A823C1|nr:uncharacterized protein LOC118181051 [Stegodyphus dumicola]XP_035206018.1 uncharacterized protein LOC118181051 [Stegodyphus dumicola]